MDRRIIVSGNCQIGGLAATLAGLLPDDEVRAVAHVPGDPGSEAEVRQALAEADVWVTNASRTVQAPLREAAPHLREQVYVPDVRFFGFHPDITHPTLRDGSALHGPTGPYASLVVLAGWRLGLDEEQVVARFAPATLRALGYASSWVAALEELRRRVEVSDLDWAEVYLPLARGADFMLTDDHPRIEVLAHLARLVGARLGADPDLVAHPWERVVPDGLLATSEAWPVYPPVAGSLGLRGGYVWRTTAGELIDLPTFVHRSLAAYRPLDPTGVDAPGLDDPRLAAVLAAEPATPLGAPA